MSSKMSEKYLKLTNTVYKLLEFFPEADPLKNRAKDRALVIMEHLVLINENKSLPAGRRGWATVGDAFTEAKIKSQLLEDIDIILGYLWIAKTQGWLNSANYLIVSNEYENIKKSTQNSLLANIVADPQQSRPTASLGGEDMQPKESTETVLANTDNKKEEVPESFVLNVLKPSSNSEKYRTSGRQTKIIEFLKKNGRAQVMDLQTVLPDITKRTIRRDLDELLQAGKVVRQGDFNQIFYRINESSRSVEVIES
jgi:DNA-binding transcriptional ArsR family regulator